MHTISWEQNGIHFDICDGFLIDKVTHTILELSGDERFDDIRYRITDYSKVNTIDVDEINQIIAMLQIQSYFFNQPKAIKAFKVRSIFLQVNKLFFN